VTPSFGLARFEESVELRLGQALEFRSGLELAYEMRSGWRVGLALYHLSNAGLARENPGSAGPGVSISRPTDWPAAASGPRRNRQAFLHGRAREKPVQRPQHVAEILDTDEVARLVEVDQVAHEGKDRDVGDGVLVVHHPLAAFEVPVDDAEQPPRLGRVTVA